MWKILLVAGAAGLVAWFISQQVPDIRRYIRISSM
ncbi:MAG: DUF6893 family small protein [Ktedonobacteraceae bacterium]